MAHRQLELIVRRSGQLDRRVPLRGGVLTLGRGDMNDIVLADIGVSRRHARLHVGNDAVMVEDAGSGNGTWFRGQRVNRQILGPGDEVVIDPFALSFENVGAEEPGESTEQQDSTQKSPTTRTAARLTVVSGHRVDRRDHPLPQVGTFTLGRSEKNLIVMPEPAASRVHAELH
jgi:pSer/pThr/pTyr-binding forkhead associated (FHA) protein